MLEFILFMTKWRSVDILPSAFLCIFFVWYIQFLWSRRKLYMEASKAPGPFGWPFVGSAFYVLGKSEDIFTKMIKLAQHYPETFKIWFGTRLYYATYDPEHIGILLKKCIAKDTVYQKAESVVGKGLFSAPKETWKKTRKLISPAFSQRNLDAFVEVFNNNADVLVKVLERFSGKGEFDVFDTVSKNTFHSICETGIGVRTDFQTSDSPLPKAFDYSIEVTFMRMTSIWYQNDLLFRFSKHAKKLKQALGQIHEFTGKVVRERMTSFEMEKQQKLEFGLDGVGEERRWKPFLDHLIEISHKEEAHFSFQNIRDEIDTFIIAGTDSTSTALCFCFTVLGMYSDIQEKVYREVLTVLGTHRPVEPADLAHLTYMNLFIKETMRIFPPAGIFSRGVDEDIDLGHFTVPKGLSIVVCTTKLHMNKKHWPDPYKFKPERFLPEEITKRHPCAYIPFFYGARNCIGQRYAMMFLKTTLSIVVRKFKVYTSYTKIEDVELKSHLTIKPINGFKVSLEQR